MGEEPERLRAQRIGFQVSRWMSDPSIPDNALPASPDDVLWLLAEVERLAGERDQIDRNYAAVCAECESLGDDNERLAGEREKWTNPTENEYYGMGARAVAAEAECERLAGRVAALETALKDICGSDWGERLHETLFQFEQRLHKLAHAALADVGGSE